jgi:hypothetical protein
VTKVKHYEAIWVKTRLPTTQARGATAKALSHNTPPTRKTTQGKRREFGIDPGAYNTSKLRNPTDFYTNPEQGMR